MPTFQKSPPQLVARFDRLAGLVPEATRRPMFGYPSCVIGGHMFMSLFRDSLVLRLGEADRQRFQEQFGATPFEPMPGRPMTGYVVVPPSLVDSDGVQEWVERACASARALPPKQPKKKRA
ncbi:MAG: TfoX/Sxy family protein [Frankiaceae bacterium]